MQQKVKSISSHPQDGEMFTEPRVQAVPEDIADGCLDNVDRHGRERHLRV